MNFNLQKSPAVSFESWYGLFLEDLHPGSQTYSDAAICDAGVESKPVKTTHMLYAGTAPMLCVLMSPGPTLALALSEVLSLHMDLFFRL